MSIECEVCGSPLAEYELEISYLTEHTQCFECFLQRPERRAELGQRIPEFLEEHLEWLAEDRGLTAYRARALQNVPQEIRRELIQYHGDSGIPDFFISGEPSAIRELLQEYGLEVDEIQSDIGVFVEVKYTFSLGSEPHFSDPQRSMFPDLQREGFDIFVFRGGKNKLWFKRYKQYDSKWIHCYSCGDKISDPEVDACYCSNCR